MGLDITEAVSSAFMVEYDFINSKRRDREIVDAKKAMCGILRVYGCTFNDIKNIMKYADTSTPRHHVSNCQELCEVDDEFNKKYNDAIQKIRCSI